MYYIEVCVGGASPVEVFEKSLFVKTANDEAEAFSFAVETDDNIPTWVKYFFDLIA